MPSFFRTAALLLGLLPAALAVRPVEVRGSDFVDTVSGKRLMIVGVDYQPGGQGGYKPDQKRDPLSDEEVCLRDAALLQKLGVNTIRVYNVDPRLNHDACASIFNAAGIYMIIDVNAPFGGESIDRSKPASSYHRGYLGRIFGVVENFKNYPNTLAFFAANEVMNEVGNAEKNPLYIRAVQRDLKQYIKNHADRPIPVGYSAADVREILEDTWQYFQCAIDGDEDDMTRSDFFGLNSYSWCGGSATFETAGYDTLVEMFSNTSIPVIFSEYGCNEVMPRVFNEVEALYSDKMSVLSGGLIYEYSQEESNYGLVEINDNGTVTLRTDFNNLQEKYNALDTQFLQNLDPSPAKKAPKCDSKLISDAGLETSFKIPEQPDGAQAMIKNGLGPDDAVRGQLVDFDNTKPEQAIYGTNGNEVDGVELRKLGNDQSNLPGGETTTGGNGGGEGNAGEEQKKAAASTLGSSSAAVALVAAVCALLTFV